MRNTHSPISFEQAVAGLPMLASLEPDMLRLASRSAQVATLPSGKTVFEPGSTCQNYIVVLDGSVKVRLLAPSGREIILYRVTGGETCVLTTSCLMQDKDYDAEAVTETDVTALLIPKAAFNEMMDNSAVFRKFIFASFSARLNGLLGLVNEVAFGHMDQRLAHWLLQHSSQGHISTTHQQIASDLGSSREVVSRLLKELERREVVVLTRGDITICNADALRQLASSE